MVLKKILLLTKVVTKLSMLNQIVCQYQWSHQSLESCDPIFIYLTSFLTIAETEHIPIELTPAISTPRKGFVHCVCNK